MCHMIIEPDAEYHQKSCHRADHCRPGAVCHITRRRNGYQTSQRSIQTHRHIRLAILHPGKEHAHDSRHGRSYCCRQKDRPQGGHVRSGCSIETIPTKPQNKHTQCRDHQVMTGKRIHFRHFPVLVSLILANPGAKHPGTHKGTDAAHHVNAVRPRVVVEAPLRQKAATPGPVCLDGVNQGGDHCRVDAVAGEFRSFRHRPGHNGRRRGAKHQVEDER